MKFFHYESILFFFLRGGGGREIKRIFSQRIQIKKNEKKKKMYLFIFFRGGDGWTDEQPQTNLPLQLLRSRGITMHYCSSSVPDKLSL